MPVSVAFGNKAMRVHIHGRNLDIKPTQLTFVAFDDAVGVETTRFKKPYEFSYIQPVNFEPVDPVEADVMIVLHYEEAEEKAWVEFVADLSDEVQIRLRLYGPAFTAFIEHIFEKELNL